MSELIDFVSSAFPWMVIGFWVAVTCLNINLKKDEQKHSSVRVMGFASFICLLLAALLKFSGGDSSGGTVFLVMGIVQFVISMNNSKDDGTGSDSSEGDKDYR